MIILSGGGGYFQVNPNFLIVLVYGFTTCILRPHTEERTFPARRRGYRQSHRRRIHNINYNKDISNSKRNNKDYFCIVLIYICSPLVFFVRILKKELSLRGVEGVDSPIVGGCVQQATGAASM